MVDLHLLKKAIITDLEKYNEENLESQVK